MILRQTRVDCGLCARSITRKRPSRGLHDFNHNQIARQMHTHCAKSILQHLGPYSHSREMMKLVLCSQVFTCFRFSPKCKCYDRLIRPECTDLKKKSGGGGGLNLNLIHLFFQLQSNSDIHVPVPIRTVINTVKCVPEEEIYLNFVLASHADR